MEGSPEPLEQRLYDLLSPFLEVAQEHGSNQVPLAEQSKAMVLCGRYNPPSSSYTC
jgi:hypothetical protein